MVDRSLNSPRIGTPLQFPACPARARRQSPDPEEILTYLMRMYEPTFAMAVKTVIDHESALACCRQFDILLKETLKLAPSLVREFLLREPQETSDVKD